MVNVGFRDEHKSLMLFKMHFLMFTLILILNGLVIGDDDDGDEPVAGPCGWKRKRKEGSSSSEDLDWKVKTFDETAGAMPDEADDEATDD